MKSLLSRRLVAPAILSAAVLAVGCQADKAPKLTSVKEEATKQWNEARASILFSLAKDQYKAGAFDKCRQTIDQASKLVPQSGPLLVLSARLMIEQGQLEGAERELALARKYDAKDPDADYLSGIVYQRWQRPETALEYYRSASQKAPAELAYLLAQAEMLVAMDKPNEALMLLQQKVTYYEHSGAIRDAVGQLQMQLGRPEAAAAMFREASILSEDDTSVRERLALALYAAKQYRDAADVLGRLTQDEHFAKRADLFTVLGECQIELGRLREARFSFETASELEPYSSHVWLGLGRAALQLGDFKRAELSLRKAAKLDKSNSESHLLLGYTSLKQDRLLDALASFETASTLDKRDTVSLCMIGYVYEKLGRADAAMDYYGRALKMSPGDEMAERLMAGVDPHE